MKSSESFSCSLQYKFAASNVIDQSATAVTPSVQKAMTPVFFSVKEADTFARPNNILLRCYIYLALVIGFPSLTDSSSDASHFVYNATETNWK